jgi:hypothetical protein
MRTGVLIGAAAAATLAVAAASATDAGACGRRSAGCGSYGPPVVYQYAPPPPAYSYAPPVPYGYVPAAPVYSWAPPRNVPAYGYRGWRNCNRGYGYGYGYAPPAAYDDDDDIPAAAWVR